MSDSVEEPYGPHAARIDAAETLDPQAVHQRKNSRGRVSAADNQVMEELNTH